MTLHRAGAGSRPASQVAPDGPTDLRRFEKWPTLWRGEIPGTHEPGWSERPIRREKVSAALGYAVHGPLFGRLPVAVFTMGEASAIVAIEPEGVNGQRRWHMSVSCPDRHPTWDELKTLRYRLLPHDRAFAIILPPPHLYVNVPSQDHVFHLHEIEDEARPWETM